MKNLLNSLSKRENATLKDLVFFQRGFDITQAEQVEGNIPVISSSGVTSYHSKSKATGPGVIIGRKGTLGTVFYSKSDYWPHDTTLWSKNLKKNNPRFVYYFIKTLKLENYNVGNANPTLNRNHIHNLKIRIPENGEQEKIAAVLSAYDDLIDTNRRRIQLLEESARLLFREWFVYFKFPGHEKVKIIKDGISKIPERWVKEKVVNVLKRVAPGELYDQTTAEPTGSVPILDQGQSGIIGYHNNEPSVIASFDNPVIVFANHTCNQRIIHFPFSAIQNIFPFLPSDINYRNIYWLHYATDNLVQLNAYKGHWPEFMAKSILLPPEDLCEEFGNIISLIHKQIFNSTIQNQLLAQARDLLLPRLMSGKIEV